jgi:hypothetical protein
VGGPTVKERTKEWRRQGRQERAALIAGCAIALAWGCFDLFVRGSAIGYVSIGISAALALLLWRSRST